MRISGHVCVVQCLKDTGIHQFRLLFILAVISAVCFAPLWVIYDLSRILNDSSLVNASLYISLMWHFRIEFKKGEVHHTPLIERRRVLISLF